MIQIIDLFLHLDKYLGQIILSYQNYVYFLLFLIIFAETGLVIAPFLPGDSLLFAIGTFSAIGSLNIYFSLALLTFAAVLGDSLNYYLGKTIGRRAFTDDGKFFLNKKHLEAAERFYEKHGARTIILARFLPIIRTFAPFVAGTGHMKYSRFFKYNVLGAFLWVWLFVLGGFLFGNIPIVRDNFSIVILAIVGISLLPVIIPFILKKLTHK